MGWYRRIAALAALCVVFSPPLCAADVDEQRQQFEIIMQGLNNNSFDRFHRATVKNDLTARIFGSRIIEPDVKKAFSQDFSSSIEQMFVSSFPQSKKDILATVIDFQVQGDSGRAVVRFAASGYRYSYHVYELKIDSKGRISIVDWVDYYQGNRFTEEAANALAMAMPGKPTTRSLLDNKDLDDRQIFQMGELFKAVRDNEAERFFQIYDGLDEVLLQERVVKALNMKLALTVRDGGRAEKAVGDLVVAYPDEPLYSLRLIEYYIPTGQFDKAIDALVVLQDAIGVRDGATESLKASAALAMGDTADAVNFAVQATTAEPSLELSWWSLLRARTAAEDYSGATEALTRLEDDFGHLLDADKLKKDRFLKVLADKQEFQDWRASRD